MTQRSHNKALQDALQYYKNLEDEMMDNFRKQGVKFAERNSHCHDVKQLLSQLKAKGANICLSNASVKYGWVSKACYECTSLRQSSSTYTATLKCNRDCFYCLNCSSPMSKDEPLHGIDALLAEGASTPIEKLKCTGITGGEPLLDLDATYAILSKQQELYPSAHKRLYTSGDFATPDVLKQLRKLGLDEIRFSFKYYDKPSVLERVFDNMEVATKYIPDVVVEMPIMPGEKHKLQKYMQRFNSIGIKGMNLLEMAFNVANWSNFEKKGLLAKNPMSPIPACYAYCNGGIGSGPVADSEQLALELMLWAIDQKFSFGMHYCSIENKYRGDAMSCNRYFINFHDAYDFDREDHFIKTAKVFGSDCDIARPILEQAGCKDFVYNKKQQSMAFNRTYIPKLLKTSVTPVISYNAGVNDYGKHSPVTSYNAAVHDYGKHYLNEVALKELDDVANG